MGQARLVQTALYRRHHADVCVQHETEVGVGRHRDVDRTCPRRALRVPVQQERRELAFVGRDTGPCEEHVHHLAPHEHGRVGEEVVLRHAHHRRGVEFRTVGAVTPRVLAAKERGDHVTNRMPVRDLRHRARFGVLRAHAAPLREDEGVPYLALGHCPAETRARYAVVLVRDALTTPDVLCRANVVHRPEHLVMDALHVIRLREPVGCDLPVARDRRSGRDGTAEVVEVRPRRVLRDALQELVE